MSHTRLSFRIQKPFHYLSNCAVWLNVPLGSVGPPYKSLLSYVHLNCTRFSQNSNARQPKPLGGTALSRIFCIFAFEYKCFTGGYFWLIGIVCYSRRQRMFDKCNLNKCSKHQFSPSFCICNTLSIFKKKNCITNYIDFVNKF